MPLPLTPERKAIRRVVVPAENPATVRATLDHWAGHYGLDPSLARALAWMESGYNPNLTSSVGAWGVMQILPTTWTYVETSLIGRPVPRTAEGNVHVGTALLHHLLNVFDGNERSRSAPGTRASARFARTASTPRRRASSRTCSRSRIGLSRCSS